MLLSQETQEKYAYQVIGACCKVGSYEYEDFTRRRKELRLNILRGLYYVITRELKVHPKIAAQISKRTRSTAINAQKKYLGYLKSKDKLTTALYNELKQELGI